MSDEKKDTLEFPPINLVSFIKEREQTETIILSDSHVEVTYKKIGQMDILDGIEDTFVLPVSKIKIKDNNSTNLSSLPPTKKEVIGEIRYVLAICRIGTISPILINDKKDLKKANQLPINYLSLIDLNQLSSAILKFSGFVSSDDDDRGKLQS